MTQTLTPVRTESTADTQSSISRKLYVAISAIILLAGACLRFYHLAGRSLWYDEAVAANNSHGTFEQTLQLTRHVSAPIVHPFLLYLSESIKSNAWMVRFPSAIASLAAVLIFLALPKAKVSSWAALFAATILSLSASQVRYAQEVREYSLGVFFAALLIFCVLRWEARGTNRHSQLLYTVMFTAPLVQYGLVLLCAAVLATTVLRVLSKRALQSSIIPILISGILFLSGGALSYALTLRYQLKVNAMGTQSYLAANYFHPGSEGLLHFLWENTRLLLSFFIPGQFVVVLLVIGGGVLVVREIRRREISTITLLLITSFCVTMIAAVRHMYPYGGIRQCLFLSPVLILFAGVALEELVSFVKGSYSSAAALLVLGVIVVSGARGIPRQKPYAEFEDNQSLLRELARSDRPGDQVWVNHDAVDAFRFYLPAGDSRFIYGKYHRDLDDYVPELRASVSPGTTRLWLVFSHTEQPSDHAEEELILSEFRQGWTVEKRVGAVNADLYLATRSLPQQTTR